MLKINPAWKQYVIHEGKKNTPTIYIEAFKALYGIVDASKLLFDALTSFLVKDLGFKVNAYDTCVVKKNIQGKQCTISWHVDDLKISHKYANVVTSIIESLSARYGTAMPLLSVESKFMNILE